MKTLTAAQTKALTYFLAITDNDKAARKSLRGYYPRADVIARLCDVKALQNVGYNYGPLFGITDAGRQALEASK